MAVHFKCDTLGDVLLLRDTLLSAYPLSRDFANGHVIDFPIEDVSFKRPLSLRIINCLRASQLYTIRHLKGRRGYLLALPNFGPRSLCELEDQLRDIGFHDWLD